MFYSATLDNVDFNGRNSLMFYIKQAKKQAEVHDASSEEADSDEQGIILTSEEQKAEFRKHLQELRRWYKSKLRKFETFSITEMFIPCRFDEDGWDGERFEGVNLRVEYHLRGDLEFISIVVEDAYVTESPYLPAKSK